MGIIEVIMAATWAIVNGISFGVIGGIAGSIEIAKFIEQILSGVM